MAGCRKFDEVFRISVDCTDRRIQEPRRLDGKKGPNPIYSSHKFGRKAGLRYEIALSIWSDHIVWVKGPFPCGRWAYFKIFKEKGLANKLNSEKELKNIKEGFKIHEFVDALFYWLCPA